MQKDGREYYKCNVCSFIYETKELADSCAEFCKKGMCNNEITKQSIKIDDISKS